MALAGSLAYFVQCMALFDGELGHRRPVEAREVGPDAQHLPQFVGQAADIGPRRHPAAELDQVAVQAQERKFLHFHLDRLKLDFLLLAGQLVGWDALDLLGGKRWRSLLDEANEAGDHSPNFFKCYINCLRWPDRVAITIVGVGGDTQPDSPLVSLLRGRIKL